MKIWCGTSDSALREVVQQVVGLKGHQEGVGEDEQQPAGKAHAKSGLLLGLT